MRRQPGEWLDMRLLPPALGLLLLLAHQARHQGQNEGSIRPFSKGLLRESLPSELETATALGHAARGLALCICPSPQPCAL